MNAISRGLDFIYERIITCIYYINIEPLENEHCISWLIKVVLERLFIDNKNNVFMSLAR